MLAVNNDQMEEKVYTQNNDFGSIVPTKSFVPDSLEDDQYGDHVVNRVITSSGKAEAGQDSSYPACLLNSHGLLVAVNEHNNSLDDHLETTGTEDIFPYKEVGMASTGGLQECDTNVSESLPVCMSPSKRVFSEEIRDKSVNKDECSLGVNIHSMKSNETAVDLPEGNSLIPIVLVNLLLRTQMLEYVYLTYPFSV